MDAKRLDLLRRKKSWDPTYCAERGGCFMNEDGTCPHGMKASNDICCVPNKMKRGFRDGGGDEEMGYAKKSVRFGMRLYKS